MQMLSGRMDLPDPPDDTPGEPVPAASVPVDHHLEELLLALSDLGRSQQAADLDVSTDQWDD